jgi:hypothetical protein
MSMSRKSVSRGSRAASLRPASSTSPAAIGEKARAVELGSVMLGKERSDAGP